MVNIELCLWKNSNPSTLGTGFLWLWGFIFSDVTTLFAMGTGGGGYCDYGWAWFASEVKTQL